ncbi:type I-E CRISPR-associated protein Cse2/CasB [Pseudogemmobacter faecipullorum]|uniref:Type I-E CRISPR-associated protein Cse2/CasB n=1 Tax=Pseudogemmobacter faecipullorum TaxID=2755041 RepID=A0ABS8CS31_9RHOB|nr:type I-E CRISPR-associated protein Cse2/CasB [Pseudogemmobacter faecipullorum]MCB5412197.1 type I-E CRISPR-associated protein Cse2/CasB [Pseudogemmobacter faecipullorum]
MSETFPRLAWWQSALADREHPHARALAARLIRADVVSALSEPAVYRLGQHLSLLERPDLLARIAMTLAVIRTNSADSFARAAGRAISPQRFERLLRAEEDELAHQLRRALPMIDRRCNVERLANDLQFWTDSTRARWVIEYHGGRLEAETDIPLSAEDISL